MAPALLALIFQSHAVLQRNVPIPIYGFIPSGAVVNVEFAGITLSTVADSTGRWAALFPAMSAGGPFTLSANASTGARAVAEDILIGDVVLCGGQSNMVRFDANHTCAPYNHAPQKQTLTPTLHPLNPNQTGHARVLCKSRRDPPITKNETTNRKTLHPKPYQNRHSTQARRPPPRPRTPRRATLRSPQTTPPRRCASSSRCTRGPRGSILAPHPVFPPRAGLQFAIQWMGCAPRARVTCPWA